MYLNMMVAESEKGGGSTIEVEIATLERLNQEDTRLCDELRASCRIGNNTRGGGVQQGKLSCWTLVQGGGVSKRAFSSTNAKALIDGAVSGRRHSTGGGSGDEDSGGSNPGSRKRVFSK